MTNKVTKEVYVTSVKEIVELARLHGSGNCELFTLVSGRIGVLYATEAPAKPLPHWPQALKS